jgi:hypothetical protein
MGDRTCPTESLPLLTLLVPLIRVYIMRGRFII